MTAPTSGASNLYRLTKHCRQRMVEMDVDFDTVLDIVHHPDNAYTSPRDDRLTTVHQKGHLAAVVDHQRHTVITILYRNNDHRVRWDRGAQARKGTTS